MLALLNLLAGCSGSDVPPPTAPIVNPAPPGAGGPMGAPPPGGDAGTAPPPAGDTPGAAPAPSQDPAGLPPTIESLATGAKGKLTVTLEGGTEATLDFVMENGELAPRVIAQDKLKAATTELTVPADRPGEAVWLSAWVDIASNGPDESDPGGFAQTAIELDKPAQTVTIKLIERPKPPAGSPFTKTVKAPTEAAPPPPPGASGPADGGAPPPSAAPPAANAPPAAPQ